MSARQATYELMHRFSTRGIDLSFDEANTLRRAELTLQRWAEMECGDGNVVLERDEQTGKPYCYRYNHSYLDPHDPRARYRVPDREAGALRRIKAICEAHGLHYFHQTDPRGCALYVDREPLPENNYTRGISCCA